jgi:hypothetical protein
VRSAIREAGALAAAQEAAGVLASVFGGEPEE